MIDDITPETKTAIIRNQVTSWKSAKVDLLVARRVAVAIGDETKAIDERLAKVERALMELETILSEV